MSKPDLTAERLRQRLYYDPLTGHFTWLCRPNPKGPSHAGKRAGCANGAGYWVIRIDGRLYLAHRLAVLYVTGQWPDDEMEVDHERGDRQDNRWGRLRVGTGQFNRENLRQARSNNSSGYLGVERSRKKWAARINVAKTRIYIGTFDSPELAHAAYLEKKRELHKGCTL